MPKTNKAGFMQYEESMPLEKLVDYLTVNHNAAVISPEHNEDTWTEQDVKRWRKSQETLHGVFIRDDATTWERKTGEMIQNELGALVPVTETVPVPKVGDLKKPHRHVYVELDYSATLSKWLDLFAPLDVNYIETINSKRGYLRYLCHLDNPEKARYQPADVISLGGVDISCIFEKTQRDADNLEIRILDVIKEHKTTSITTLQHVLLHEVKDMEAYREVKSHFGYWRTYLGGLWFEPTTVQLVKDVETRKPRRVPVDADGVVRDEVA